MRFTIAVALIFAVTFADDSVDLPFHSKPWICTHLVKIVYDYAIMNVVATSGVDCFDELMALPDIIKDMTPIKIFPTYMVVGPYIGKSKTSRSVVVFEDDLESKNLGTKIKDTFPVECLKCNMEYYGDNIAVASCNDLTMEECPERLSGEMYWDPPGNITSSSDAEFCMYRKENGTHKYICMIFDADLDVQC
ncbi:uncharacterized protein [Ptychodera flava]|uniref:uncharacterized protein n=1 Tax=Ptychodera flava TaxID=63121 RepID=UPI00396A4B7D